MNKKKLDEYNLTGSIHTLAIKSPGIVNDIDEKVSKCIVANSSQSKTGETTTSIINPNKLLGDVFSYSEFETTFATILGGAGITDYNLIRADMRFDNYEPDHYKKYAKLNRYLISMLAVTYRTKNNYKTNDLFNQRQLSVAIKNDYFEIENYDREAKSKITENHEEPAKARLEERTVSRGWRNLYKKNESDQELTDWNMILLKKEFTDGWFSRWDKAIQNIDKVHQRYNDELEKLYKEDKNSYPTRFRSLTDFLIQYQDCIFCKAQMIDLLSRFDEVKNPKTRAENHKKRYGIEYFSQKDVVAAVEEVKRATRDFFSE
jgi:hypothetical protein